MKGTLEKSKAGQEPTRYEGRCVGGSHCGKVMSGPTPVMMVPNARFGGPSKYSTGTGMVVRQTQVREVYEWRQIRPGPSALPVGYWALQSMDPEATVQVILTKYLGIDD